MACYEDLRTLCAAVCKERDELKRKLAKYEKAAADVAPVVHGRWIGKKRWGIGKWHKWLECSECGHQDYDLDMYEDMPFTAPGNYCPNCGARMDGE